MEYLSVDSGFLLQSLVFRAFQYMYIILILTYFHTQTYTNTHTPKKNLIRVYDFFFNFFSSEGTYV